MKIRRLRIGIALLLCACGSASGEDTVLAAVQGAMHCQAGEQHACPCLGGGMGMQMCAANGMGFDVCAGCKTPIGMTRGVGGGAGALALDAGTSTLANNGPSPLAGRDAGASGAAAGTAGTGGASGGGAGSAAGRGGSSSAGGAGGAAADADPGKPDQLPAVKGVSCGVGLPVQCDAESEKCCKRSLSTDSCIPTAMACQCDVDSCDVVDVRCDGPEDCAQGQVCCAAGGSSGIGSSGRSSASAMASYSGFACATSCSSPQRQACHTKADCPTQLTCAISQVLATISVCTDPKSLQQ